MCNLSLKQIDFVISEVTNAEITFSHLKDDLIDHLCCEIESEIRRGSNFEEAFDKIKQSVGVRSIRKVQENTLLLIDKKYRFMKTTMKISGLISMSMLIFGALFKIMHWPGAGPLLVFGFVFMSLLFFPTALWVMKKESKLKSPTVLYVFGFFGGLLVMLGFLFKIMHWPGAGPALVFGFSSFSFLFMPTLLITLLKTTEHKGMIAAYIIGAISFSICILGELFKIMHWPGASPMLVAGSILLATVFFPLYSHFKYKDSKSVESSFIFLCIGLLFFSFFNNMLAMNVSKSVLNTFVSPIKSLISETENIDKSNTVIYQGLRDDKKEALIQIRNKAAEVSKLIENIKIDIVSNTEKVDNNEALKIIENLQLLRTKDNYDIPTFIMIGPDQVKGETGRAHELKLKIEEYKNLLLEKSNNDIYKEFANGLLNTSDAYNYHFNGMSTWEMNMFYHTINISTLGILTHLDLNVKLAENEAIKQISSSNGKDSLSIKNIK